MGKKTGFYLSITKTKLVTFHHQRSANELSHLTMNAYTLNGLQVLNVYWDIISHQTSSVTHIYDALLMACSLQKVPDTSALVYHYKTQIKRLPSSKKWSIG